MPEFLNFDRATYEAAINGQLFQVSWVSIFMAGLVSGYFKHQYGRPIKKIELWINFLVLVYVLSLMFIENFAFSVLFMHYYMGGVITYAVYRFILNPYFIGPNLSRLTETVIDLEKCKLNYKHPVPNSESRWITGDRDYKSCKFQRKEDAKYRYKDYLQRCWVYYDREGEITDGVVLHISVQDMPGYQDLFQPECLNGAAAHFYFSHHVAPVSSYDYDVDDESEHNPMCFRDWQLHHVKSQFVISYRVESHGLWKTQYIHTAISKKRMLTITLESLSTRGKIDKIDPLIACLKEGWSLSGNDVDQLVDVPDAPIEIVPPKFNQFNYRLKLSTDDKWRKATNEYDKMRQIYIDTQLEKCRAMCIVL